MLGSTASLLNAQENLLYIDRDSQVTRPGQERAFEVRPMDPRGSQGPLRSNKAPQVDKGKVKSIFDKANTQPEPRKKSSGAVATDTATGTSKSSKNKPRTDRVPPPVRNSDRRDADKPNEPETIRKPDIEGATSVATEVREGQSGGARSELPTISADDVKLFPGEKLPVIDLSVYQQVPERAGVELPKGGPQLPGTGLPGDDGIGGIKGGYQGGLKRPTLGHDSGEERYQGEAPGTYDPAIDPSGALGDAGGVLGAAGQAYGGKNGKTMEQVGGLLQSESGAQALGRGADIVVPGAGSFVEAAASGNRQGMVNAGATAAGNLASDLAIGLIIGFVGGGILGMAIGYALSATGAGRIIADGVTAGVKWVAEKIGVGGSEPPPQPAPEPEPPPDSGSYDENYSKNNGKRGPSVVNEIQLRPLQDKMNEDLLGENRDAEEFIDTSDAPMPGRVAVGAGCNLEDIGKSSGSFNPNRPLTIKDMERPGYDAH